MPAVIPVGFCVTVEAIVESMEIVKATYKTALGGIRADFLLWDTLNLFKAYLVLSR